MRLSRRSLGGSAVEEESRDRGVVREEVTEVLPVGTAVAPEGWVRVWRTMLLSRVLCLRKSGCKSSRMGVCRGVMTGLSSLPCGGDAGSMKSVGRSWRCWSWSSRHSGSGGTSPIGARAASRLCRR